MLSEPPAKKARPKTYIVTDTQDGSVKFYPKMTDVGRALKSAYGSVYTAVHKRTLVQGRYKVEPSNYDPPDILRARPTVTEEAPRDEIINADDRRGVESFSTPDYIADKRKKIRQGLDDIGNLVREVASGTREMPKGYNPSVAIEVLQAEADAVGLDFKHVTDGRTDAEKIADASEQLLRNSNSILEQTNDVLDALDRSMSQIVTDMGELIAEKMKKAGSTKYEPDPGDPQDPKTRAGAAQRWIDSIRRLRRIRTMVEKPIPPWISGKRGTERLAWEASRSLRYQLYVGRSDFGSAKSDVDRLFSFGPPHIKMALDMYLAENKVKIAYLGPLWPGDQFSMSTGNYTIFNGTPYAGAMMLYPPRHGKSSFLRHWVGLKISTNHRTQGAYIHDRNSEAVRFKGYVTSLFDPTTETGRRNLSMFPATLAKRDNNANRLRVQNADPTSNPNLVCESVMSSAQGNNLDWLIADDIVPSSDVLSQADRDRRKHQFRQTWLTRFQGGRGFFVIAGYPFHFDDIVWEYRNQAHRAKRTRGREGIVLLVSAMPVGGPETNPPFFSIWDKIDRATLRQFYRSVHDRAIWSANYQLNPIADSMRIVRHVECYDPQDQQHYDFLNTAAFHLSLDPAYSNNSSSDRAGIVLVAIGDVVRTEETGGRTIRHSRIVVRVIEARETHATQKELSDIVADTARARKIDLCHIEGQGGQYAMRDFLSSMHGINSVVEHKAGARSKEARLRRVASMIEASAADIRPVVQFPGSWSGHGDDRGLHPTDAVQQLVNYIINFRVMSGHHSLDALTQVCAFLAPQCGIGGIGDVSVEAGKFGREADVKSDRERKKKMLDRIMHEAQNKHSERDHYSRIARMVGQQGT